MTISDLRENNLILLECISGSKAYGLDTAASDTDIKGVFYLPVDEILGLTYTPQVSNETNDIVFYELGRFIELLIKNNPTILEILATPEASIIYQHPIMKQIQLSSFLSRLCKESFAGYALSQVRKAKGYNKKVLNPTSVNRKSLIDYCYVILGNSSVPLTDWLAGQDWRQQDCGLARIPHANGLYALYYQVGAGYNGIIKDSSSDEVSISSVAAGAPVSAHMYVNRDGYSSYCREYREYREWVAHRNETRFLANTSHGRDYDSKNMMHMIRLLQSALQILTRGQLDLRCNNREELLSIKSGAFTYDELMARSQKLMDEIEQAASFSTLPEKPDAQALQQLLVSMRKQLYQTDLQPRNLPFTD